MFNAVKKNNAVKRWHMIPTTNEVTVDEVYDAAKDAEIQLVQNGEISAETLTTVSRELVTREELVARAPSP